jgi:histone-lysine N-methyltransferase SETMAR
VPYDLSDPDKPKRVADARLLWQAPRNDQSQNSSHIMTGDESWFYYNDESSTVFTRARDEVVPRVSSTICSKKVMVTIFFTVIRLLRLPHLPQGQKCHKEYFMNEILEGINQECNQGTGHRVTKTMTIQMDRCRVHNALETSQVIGRMKIERLAHPPYSPDLSPCHFSFFGPAKTALQNRTFWALIDLFDSVTFEELQSVFQNWIERLKWVIRHTGEYFIK